MNRREARKQPLKEVLWIGTSRKDLRAFPDQARQQAGYEIYRVQKGIEPTDWKPVVSVGLGVREIRVRVGGEHRVMYVARFSEGIYVLHAFRKKTRKTPKAELDLLRVRLREVERERNKKKRAEKR